MPWNVGKNSLTGECCGCDTAPCEDCKKDDPKEPCDCRKDKIYYNNISTCEDANPDKLCIKCLSFGPCNEIYSGTLGTHGCYLFYNPGTLKEFLKTCEEIGCRDKAVDPLPECEKEVTCGECEAYGTFCYKDAPKNCSDFSFYDENEAYAKCVSEETGTINDVLTCSKVESTGCPGLLCYSCKDCFDFNADYQESSSCPPGQVAEEVVDDSSLNKCEKMCYRCVPSSCDCTTVKGYFNSPPVNSDPDCLISSSKSGVLPFPCEAKTCYYNRCSDCADKGYLYEEPSPQDPCYKYEEKRICDGFQFDSGQDECDSEICYDKVKRTCSDFASEQGKGNKCAKDASECDPNEYFKESDECLVADPEFGGCSELDGECKGICKEYCGWKIIGGPDFEKTNPSATCDTTAFLSVINSNCTSGSAASVAANNISGFFTVTCPPGDPCEGKVPSTSWPPGPGFGGGSFASPTTVVSFSWEDCGISPGDGVIYVTLERCEECA